MKIFFNVLLGSFLLWTVGFVFPGGASALNLGSNITVYDGSGTGTGWYGTNEDQEVEPNCVTNQGWDLEGFFLKDSELQVVGGFNFLYGNSNYDIGDIFLDIDNDYDPTNSNNNNYGYDYVLDLDVGSGTYSIFDISGGPVTLSTVYFSQNSNSNPYRYESGGHWVKNGTLNYLSGLGNTDVGGLLGGTHYALTGIDLGLIAGEDFTAHLTLECGNDNLMGQGTAPVPEPATLILLGTGLIGIAGFSRRKIKKKA